MLTKEQKELLARMRADNAASPAPFRTTGHWEQVNSKFDAWFNELGIGDVVNQKYNEHFSGEPRRVEATEKFLDYMTGGEWRDPRELARWVLQSKIAQFDSCSHGYLTCLMPDPPWGVLTALDAFYSFNVYHSTNTIVDIGAGWGRIGYVLKRCKPYARYIICDLPESLLLSQSYLPAMLPNVYHGAYDELGGDSGCYYLPAHRILDLPDKSADVIVNIASFQEMPPDYVSAYFDIIDKKGKYLYTLQRGHPDKRPKCPSKPHWKLLFSRHPIWSDRYYEAMFEL